MDTLGNNNNTILKEEDKSESMLRDSEDLVRIAIENRVAITQIRHIYERSRTQSKVEFQVFLKYQMGRSDPKTGSKILPRVFGDKLLLLYEKYQYHKHCLITILKFVVMLYEYEKSSSNNNFSINNVGDNIKDYWNSPQQKKSQQPPLYNNINPDIKRKLEKTIENNTKNYGFDKIEIDGPFTISASFRQGYQARLKIKVHLKRFYDNPRELSDHLKTILQNQIPDISPYEIIIWIERGSRF